MSEQNQNLEGIAIVGMAGRFPGSGSIAEYWDNLKRGVESITVFDRGELAAAGVDPGLLAHPDYVPAGGVLDGIELFDAAFFGFSPREAELIDPQHRLFLEASWEALESAGYDSQSYVGSIGVFGGMSMSKYLLYNLLPNREILEAAGPLQTRILNDKDFLASLTAYKLNLTGPSLSVQTACSTSLVATCLACQSLMSYQCELALAGGVSVTVPHREGYLAQDGVLAPDGHCRAFDVRAAGTVDGNGVGVVVLKRLADAVKDGDTIHAVIKGFATNNDGSFKMAYTAPSVDGQMEAIALAQAVAGVSAETVTLIEAHGTATPLGDPIEVAALREVFESATDRKGYCALGSVKTNIGHLDAAAGVASLIKASLAVRDGVLPPSLHFETPNPQLELEDSPFYVNTRLSPWNPGPFPRRAGVSAFAIGGVNAHVVLEEPPPAPAASPAARPWQLLTLSARSRSALDTLTEVFARDLAERPDLSLADVAYTCHVGRRPFPHRRVVVCRDAADTADVAAALVARDRRVLEGVVDDRERQVAFLFPGLGNHYPGMAAGLYRQEPVFRAEVDRCCEILAPTLGLDLRGLLFPEDRAAALPGKLDLRRLVRGASDGGDRRLLRTALSQPAVFVIEYALARLWMHWGVQPQALLGFSIGEYVAACLAGVLSLEDSLLLVARRAAAIEKLPDGAMLAVPLGEAAASRLLEGGLALASAAAPEVSVLAGPVDEIARLEERLAADGLVCRRLETTHAFHSPLLRPAAAEIEALMRGFELRPPEVPFLSNVTGTWIRPEEATDPAYWTRHLLGTVRFADGVAELLRERRILLEVGPGQTLSSWALQSGRGESVVALPSLRHAHDPRPDLEFLLGTLGQLWLEGVAPDWSAFHEGESRRRIPLPTYPFERRRYWLEAPRGQQASPVRTAPEEPATLPVKRPDPGEWLYVPAWRQSPVPPVPADGAWEERSWLLFLDRHGVGEALRQRLAAAGVPAVPVVPGAGFRDLEGDGFEIDPRDPESYARLFATLAARGGMPGTVVHLAGIEEEEETFYSLLYLAQAVGRLDRPEPLRIEMVTSHLQAVTGDERVVPEKATLLGACATLPQEYPTLRCRSIDLPPPGSAAAETLAGLLLAELGSGRSEPVVAYRGGRRWVRHFESLPLPENPGTRLRQGGVYLITGGTGGIGLVLAERLARRAGARLVLVGRSEVPAREEWSRLAAVPSVEGELGWRVARLREIEAAGGELLLLRADVSDPEQARQAVAAARQRFGRIDGVVHAAGVFPGGLAQLKTRETVGAVFAPKLAGTRALTAALADDPPDFFVLCSSLTGIAGAFGLVDHAAANTFLDAYAQAGGLSPRTFTLAVDWDGWLEVGQAARGARAMALDSSEPELAPGSGEPGGHLLLDTRSPLPDGRVVFQSRFSTASHWVLDEHRLLESGLLPGTAYLEMIRAAVESYAGPGPVEIRNLVFAQPLTARDGEVLEVRVELEPAADGHGVRVLSRSLSGGPWQVHARGHARLLPGEAAARHDLTEIRDRCRVREVAGEAARPEGPLRFGPRWRGLFDRVYIGDGEGLAFLRLAPELAGDLEDLVLHPALLDGATAFALALAEGTFLPMVYERAVVLGPLPAEVASHARLQGEPTAETLTCDVTVMDGGGVERLRVEGFTLKRLRDETVAEPAPTAAMVSPIDLYHEGILPAEGADLFERLLSTAVTSPQVVVSVRDLDRVLELAAAFDRERLLEKAGRLTGHPQRHPRPDLRVAYVEPRGELEARLATIWEEMLGLDRVGVHDNFFDLGGDSLLATRLISVVGRELAAELSLRALFEAPTVAELAEAVAGQQAGSAPTGSPRIERRGRPGGTAPASFSQQRLWYIQQLFPEGTAYNVAMALRLSGQLDRQAMAGALGQVVRRHEALRTTFREQDGDILQVIAPPSAPELPVVDLSGVPHREHREEEARRLADEEAGLPFDLAAGPLLRVRLLRLGQAEHVLLLTVHHIVVDAWSLGVLLQEIAALYTAGSPLPDLPVQYADFAVWQREWLQGEILERQLDYWRRQLAGDIAPLDLPAARERRDAMARRGALLRTELDPDLCAALRGLGRQADATLFMTLLAAFKTVLHRYTGQADVVVGTPVAGRLRAELEGLIGYFLNALALRSDLSGDPTFLELLRDRVRTSTLDAFAHQEVPFETLVTELQPDRDLVRSPFFQVMFNLVDIAELDPSQIRMGDLSLEVVSTADQGTAKFDLTLYASPVPGGGLGLDWVFDRDLFERGQIEELAGHFHSLLAAVAEDPERRLSAIPLRATGEAPRPADSRFRLEERTGFIPFDSEEIHASIPECFERRTRLYAERLALRTGRHEWTYRELGERARRIAAALPARSGEDDRLVALLLEHDAPMIAGMLGALQAGRGYVPLDPTYPEDRLAYVLADSGAGIVITNGRNRALAERLAGYVGDTGRILDLDELPQALPEPVPPPVSPDDVAYILYTSGSTGKPKGVVQSHRNVLHHVRCYTNALRIGPEDRLSLLPSYAFDAAVMDIYGALLNGAALLPRDLRTEGLDGLADWVAREGITIYHSTPTVYRHFVGTLQGGEAFDPLRLVVLGGEEVQRRDVELYRERLPRHTLFVNGMGPTESTLALQCFLDHDSLPHRHTVPVGWPVEDTEVVLVNAAGEQVAVYGTGEIAIRSAHIALGYWRQPELTREAFLPDPDGGDRRVYRTGDLGRRLPDGSLEFVGRRDRQVKIRGHRVELGEVEAVLAEQPQVREAAVVLVDDDAGEARLVAYVASDDPGAADGLRARLETVLPPYMVPGVFVVLDSLPLTPTGKIDRLSLPMPDWRKRPGRNDEEALRTPTEEILAGLWAEILGLDRVGPRDNFFDLGGHSLLATRLAGKIRGAFSADLPLRSLFEAPTVRELAGRIDLGRRGVALPPLVPQARAAEVPLSSAQQRLWFLQRLEPGSVAYHIAGGVSLTGDLDPAALLSSLREVVRRHEVLRTTFSERPDGPVQSIRESLDPEIAVLDLGALPPSAKAAEAARLTGLWPRLPFDLENGPLMRSGLLALGGGEHALLLSLHHVVSDGWSLGILVREVGALYDAFSASQPSPLPGLPVQYADFALWQRRVLDEQALAGELAWWRERLLDRPAELALPTDRPRPAVRSASGARHRLTFAAEPLESLRALGRAQGATLFMTMLAVYQVLLRNLTGQDDLLVGTPVANRHQEEVEGLIGCFVNTLVLRTAVPRGGTFRELLARVRETTLEAYDHQQLPFEKLVEDLQPQRNLSQTPLFQTLVVLQNAPMPPLRLQGLELRPFPVDGGAAKFDLTLAMEEAEGGGLRAVLEYGAGLFEASTIQRWGEHLRALLGEAALHPDAPVGSLAWISPAELHQVLWEWNPVPRSLNEDICLHDLFLAQVEATPGATAVSDEESELSYAELNARANRVARRLLELGVGPEVLVAVCLERSVAMPVALLGVLKAGGAYVPLDPSYPADRLAYMLDSSGAPVLLTQEPLLAILPPTSAEVLVLPPGGLLEGGAGALDDDPAGGAVPDSPAYAIFTSGSTGRPKGAVNTHRAICNRLLWMQATYRLGPDDRVVQKTPFSFDVSVWELFWPLLVGAELVMARPGGHLDPEYLVRLLAERRITTAHFVPSMLQVFVEMPGVEACTGLRRVICSGEALPLDLQQRFFERLGCELHNLYGPTEAAVDVTFWRCERGTERRTVPIGRPIDNLRIHLVDREMRPVPQGVPGELLIAGTGLARGYLGRPDLTAERFVPHPFAAEPGARVYRTGDLARHLPGGEIDYLGRIDHQVKLRGIRIELGEIEAVLAQAPGVQQSAVLVREDRPGDPRLVGYVVADQGAEVSVPELRAFLRLRLPEPMVPGMFVFLDAFPLSPSGKLDRRALPAPTEDRPEVESRYTAPRNPTEQTIAEIWAEVLRLERVGIHDNFFELGGHSLLATQVFSRVRLRFGYQPELRTLYEQPTVERMARAVDELAHSQTKPARPRLQAVRRGSQSVDSLLLELNRSDG